MFGTDNTPRDTFADLEEIITGTPQEAGVDFAETEAPRAPMFIEVCAKCRGSGTYYGRSRFGQRCFACKGAGKFERRTSPEQRAAAKASRERSLARKAESAIETFATEHPAAHAWIIDRAPRFNFAAQMKLAVEKYGHLTEGQLAAVARLIAQDAERDAARAVQAQERVEREASAPVVDIARVEAAIAAAAASGLKRIALRLASFKFSPAPAHGRNAGAIYVKTTGGDYLGKVSGGKFVRAFGTCDEATAAEVIKVAGDPEAAAVAYGKKFGQCACCGRELSDPESVARGIGPVCAGRFGWGA